MAGEKPRRIFTAAAVLLCTACAAPEQPPSGALTPPQATRSVETVTLGSAITSGAASDDYRAGWASRLIGSQVIDPRGSHLGMLSDFIIHTGSGDARYGVVSNKRAPGGERLVAVPLRLLHVTDEDALLLDLAQERFDRLEWWSPDRWPVLHDTVAWDETDRLWGLRPLPAGEPGVSYRVSGLMGTYVDDPAGGHLGRIIDVVIDLNRHAVHYTVLRLQGHPGVSPDHAFAAPLESLTLPGSGRATLAASQVRLMNLVGTDPDEAPPGSLRYLGVIDRDFGVAFPQDVPDARAVGATR